MGGLDGATTNFVKKYYMQCVPLQGIHMQLPYGEHPKVSMMVLQFASGREVVL